MSKVSRLTDEFGNVPKFISSTVGASTINAICGQAIIAGAASSVVVTNNQVAATSIILVTLATNDATATIKNVVAAAGSFTITATAAATGNTAVNFLIIN